MAKNVAIGIQNFETMILRDCFYVDKTDFIREWWENGDDVTLIARPRRFGKTLNMSMLETFFSNKYENRGELFEGLEIWKEEKYRGLQGTYPVISLSFANVKETSYEMAVYRICEIVRQLYESYHYLMVSEHLTEIEKEKILSYMKQIEEKDAPVSIRYLAMCLEKYYGKKVIILLDEYDTPMQEAYVNGYWEKFTSFIRSMFNSTFKTNPYLERAVMTGITRVSRESIFSDLNNLAVITTTGSRYATAFGFTEEEVFGAMEERGLTDKEGVKYWYDGFVFGEVKDIYNPWSIINYMKEGKLSAYWANTSSNRLVGKLIREGDVDGKKLFERLLRGESIEVPVDEQIVYHNLGTNEGAIWSLMLATGYLKVMEYQTGEEYTGNMKPIYRVALTNYEVKAMFYQMVSDWFGSVKGNYNDFIKALLLGDLDAMNEYMERVTSQVFSSFDTGGHGETELRQSEPERFYHGFVLALMVDMSEKYMVKSNRESGFGRYDIMIYPKDKKNDKQDGIIIEFKVRREKREANLEDTVKAALKQIEEKNYTAELLSLGFEERHIKKYGFAFEGKKVLIGTSH